MNNPLLKKKVSREQGTVLIATLLISAVIGTSLGAYLMTITVQHKSVIRSQTWNDALPVAEAGIEEALSQLQQNGPSSTGGGFTGNLAADGWTLNAGGTAYSKQRYLDTNSYYVVLIPTAVPPQIVSTGYVRMPASANYVSRRVQITTSNSPIFFTGALAKKGITSNGNSVMADAFDSSNPLYSTNGQYIASKATDGGGLATLSSAANALNFGGGKVYGTVQTGPGGSVPASLTIGTHAWQATNASGIQPGYLKTNLSISLPDVKAPFASASFPIGGTVGGVVYTYILSGGNWMINIGSLSGKVLVTGNATLYVTSAATVNFSATTGAIIVQPNASLNLYVGSGTATLPNVVNSNTSALNFSYYGLNSNTNIMQTVNADFTGTIYAPYAKYTLGGNGSGSTQNLFGSFVVDSIFYNDSFFFHYDLSLANTGPSRGYTMTSWREL